MVPLSHAAHAFPTFGKLSRFNPFIAAQLALCLSL